MKNIEDTITYARLIEESGCKLLTVHGRTRDQRGVNTGLASWDAIRSVKMNVNIPVFCNGNVRYNGDVYRAAEYTKCEGVMVAETHLYNPLIFTSMKKDCFDVVEEYLGICKEIKSRNTEIKSHVFKILHGVLEHENEVRVNIQNAGNLEDLIDVISNFRKIKGHNFILPSIKMRHKIIIE